MFKKKKDIEEVKELNHANIKGFVMDMNSFLKMLSLILIILLGGSLFLAYKAYQKPPIVIRENAKGQIQVIKNLLYNDKVTKLEIYTFSKLFLRRYLSLSSYGVANQLDRALRMMSEKYEKENIYSIEKNNTISNIQNANIREKIKIKKIRITKIEGKYIYLKVFLNIIKNHFENKKITIETVEGHLVLKKVLRSASRPYGLEIAIYSQTILNKIKQK
ncbi:MAG: hypothetical protein EVJ46_00110 [Candidatus Acididesulfobacter guangdongensis]|uniref:Bacterial virulence protein VirB8 domain-containing protein n=1 Tax=Acididesulfobacter guangdongensis TaxID=2597225 RepID=A0A519BHE7_ACIG2|nr:MAG: hypothetical protein EVJ46_00110 [Candidatus Acididesulfobacter guangdongensis]